VDLLHKWVPRIIAGIISIIDASNLRNKVHLMQDEHELMWTALDDIARMYKDHPSAKLASETLKNISTRYGR
jgi:hypothetical protein